MPMSKKEYARKRIHIGSSVQIENSVTRVTIRHHSASLVISNSYPRDRIFNQHLTTIIDFYYVSRRSTRDEWTPQYSYSLLVGPKGAVRVVSLMVNGYAGMKDNTLYIIWGTKVKRLWPGHDFYQGQMIHKLRIRELSNLITAHCLDKIHISVEFCHHIP